MRHFDIRRTLRIWPLYYASILLLFLALVFPTRDERSQWPCWARCGQSAAKNSFISAIRER
ncbi:MAG: hypothetical protein HXY40_18610 [Chloroflexi bacterium]|nr:hypothetical protein [Chloroflexota bacterium]